MSGPPPRPSRSSTPATLPPKREVATGIQNMGSTCYMNAVLQALAHAPDLCNAIDAQSHSTQCPKNSAYTGKIKKSRSGDGGKDGSVTTTCTPVPAGSSSSSKTPSPTGTIITANGLRKSTRTRSSPSLHNDFGYGGEIIKAENFCTLCEIEQHLTNVHSSTSAVQPRTFVNGFIQHVAPATFQLGIQEDSHEFLRLLIDAMQKSCKESRAATASSDEKDDDKENSDTKTADQQQSGTKKEKGAKGTTPSKSKAASITANTVTEADDIEYPFRLFRGTVESKVRCESCNATSSKIDPIEDIGLEVIRNPSSYGGGALCSVSDAFDKFIQSEPLSGYKCDKCNVTGTATKVSKLASVPPILTLHLKRFRYGGAAGDKAFASSSSSGMFGNFASNLSSGLYSTGRRGSSDPVVAAGVSGSAKIDGHVKFTEVLMLDPYMKKDGEDDNNEGNTSSGPKKKVICRLFAVIVHSGKNSHSGHYIAFVRSVHKNEWWKMDDHRVVRSSKQEVLAADAYMLFYQVVNHPVGRSYKAAAEEEYNAKLQLQLQQDKEEEEAELVKQESKSGEGDEADVQKATPSSEDTPEATDEAVAEKKSSKKRGRESESSVDGQGSNDRGRIIRDWNAWAQSRTNIPPDVVSVFRQAQERIATGFIDHGFTAEFKQRARKDENGFLKRRKTRHGDHLGKKTDADERHNDPIEEETDLHNTFQSLQANLTRDSFDYVLKDSRRLFWKLAKGGTTNLLKKLASKAANVGLLGTNHNNNEATVGHTGDSSPASVLPMNMNKETTSVL